jgi:hypothetical protein
MCAPLTLHSPKLQTNVIPFGCGINYGGQTEVPRLETGTLPLHARSSPSHSTEGWARDGGRMLLPRHIFLCQRGAAAAARVRPCANFYCSGLGLFTGPSGHLMSSCAHAPRPMPLSSHTQCQCAHKTPFRTLPGTMKLNILLSSSRFGICKI